VYFAWEKRAALMAAEVRPGIAGLALVGFSLFVLLAGLLGAELFLTRVSLIGIIAGSVWFIWGWRHLRVLAFPILLLFLMVPLPALVFNQIAFPLQLLASRAGEAVLTLAGVPVLREGNVLELASTKLEVAQACSGIRSLISLLTLGMILGKLAEPRLGMRVLLALLTVPVAIAANAARVAGTGLAANWIGPEAAEGFLHTFSGWLVFVAAFALLLVVQRALARIRFAPGVGRTRAALGA
jgi:exosortase